ncbi:MAG: nucleotide exchange factor GrpE [Myxococcaceae bacterium]|nr:nucleotide exchange factor GrpE [Myxococcaceae bacterium]
MSEPKVDEGRAVEQPLPDTPAQAAASEPLPEPAPEAKAEDTGLKEEAAEKPEGARGPQPEPEAAPAEPVETVESLKLSLAAAHRRIDELARAIQAGERDREAFKQRLTRERERMIDVEKGNVAQTLLEAVDELDLSLKSANDDSPLAKGVRMIRDGMLSKLNTLGVERVELIGKPFDPNLAEALDMEITANPEDDQKVVAEIRPAYRLKDRIIRPGQVKVARYVEPAKA